MLFWPYLDGSWQVAAASARMIMMAKTAAAMNGFGLVHKRTKKTSSLSFGRRRREKTIFLVWGLSKDFRVLRRFEQIVGRRWWWLDRRTTGASFRKQATSPPAVKKSYYVLGSNSSSRQKDSFKKSVKLKVIDGTSINAPPDNSRIFSVYLNWEAKREKKALVSCWYSWRMMMMVMATVVGAEFSSSLTSLHPF